MSPKDEIYSKISHMIHVLFEIPLEDIRMESKLYEDLDLDSIDAVDLIVALQQEVQIRVMPEQFKNVRTIEDVVVTVESILTENKISVNEVQQ